MDLNRKIYIYGEITDESLKKFSLKLSRLQDESDEDISIELVSEGGDAYAALAYFDLIRNSQCGIRIHAYGYVASAATIILAAGDHRRMSPSSWLMVHEDSTCVDEGMSVSAVERSAAHARRLEQQWCKLLEGVSKTSEEKWAVLHKAETYLTADECLKLGIIDEII